MISEQFKNKAIKILICTGLCITILSALEPHVEWLSNLCGFLGDGCKDTEQFLLFSIPVSIWGIFFYIALLIAALFARSSVFWLTMCGVGVECILIKIMLAQKFICVLCLLNLVTMIFLFLFIINRNRIWHALSLIFFLFILSDIFINSANPIPQISAHQNESSIIAIAGGTKIFKADIEAPLAGKLSKLEKNIYNLKRKELNEQIKKIILEKSAKEKSISTETLIRSVLSKVKKVSDEEIDAHYNEHKDYYDARKGSVKSTKQKIRNYLQENKLSNKIKEYVEPLKKKYGVVDYLTRPPMPIANINIEKNPFSGPKDAKVTIIEFSDYLCPSCRRAHKLTKEVKELYKGKIKWVFKDFPLKRHKGAKRLAAAARAAGEQGKFWEYQDLLFASKDKPDDKTLINYAKKLGLNVNLFMRSLNSKKFLPAIESDIQDAQDSGISSTPTFIINGKLSSGSLTLEEFKRIIDKDLKK